MTKILFFLFAITCLIQVSCNSASDKLTYKEIINNYINGLNESNYKQIEMCISDSLTTVESNFVLTESSNDYYKHFQWDSVFSPKYDILNSKKISDHSVEITLSKIGDRIKYLHDTVTVYKAKFDFADDQIIKIDNFELVYFDTLKWNSRRDTLVAWVKTNHANLDGFIYDQTLTGAQNYLKAIELYKARN